MDKLRKKLIKYYMDNPCLSQEIDYQVDEMRLEYYTNEVNTLEDYEVYQELEELELYQEKVNNHRS